MWNKWQIIELVIIFRNDAKKTVVFKTYEPNSGFVFRRQNEYSSLHFPLWPKNCLNSVHNVYFDMSGAHWYTLFKISLWQTRYKALEGNVSLNLLNLEHMTSWASCQLPFLFWTTVSKICEANWRSRNPLWTKSFYEAIKVNMNVF